VQLKALPFGYRRSGGGVESAAEKNDRVSAHHFFVLWDFCPFHRIAFLIPAGDALVENFHVAVTLFVKNAIGQTGQVVRASSIQDDQAIVGNALQVSIELLEGGRNRAQNMQFTMLFL
jgi:hypothetical protein